MSRPVIPPNPMAVRLEFLAIRPPITERASTASKVLSHSVKRVGPPAICVVNPGTVGSGYWCKVKF